MCVCVVHLFLDEPFFLYVLWILFRSHEYLVLAYVKENTKELMFEPLEITLI